MAHDYYRSFDTYHCRFLLVCLHYASIEVMSQWKKINRFLFPDSPTNAWFLTKEERKIAVSRLKVCVYICFRN